MKKRIYSYFFVLLLGFFALVANGQLAYNGWVYVDGDEFNGVTLDLEKGWRLLDETSLAANKELQYYTTNGNFGFAQDAYGRYLQIITKKETITGRVIPYLPDNWVFGYPNVPPQYNLNLRTFDYTSANIVSRQPYFYGKFEIRCRIPAQQGLWPAFWLRGQPDEEIDIEFKGEVPYFVHWANHDVGHTAWNCGFFKNKQCQDWYAPLPLVNFSGPNFNTVGIIWMPNFIGWTLNGNIYKYVLHDYSGPMRVIANTAVANDLGPFEPGPTLSTVLPATYDIDWIRIWAPIDCNDQVQLCNYIQSQYDPTVKTGGIINVGDGFCTNVFQPDGAPSSSSPPFYTPNAVKYTDLIASERVIINPNTYIFLGCDFTARITPCSEVKIVELDTTGYYPDSISVDQGGEEGGGSFTKINSPELNTPPQVSFPNPTNGIFTFENNMDFECRVELINNIGNVIQKTLVIPNEEKTFDLSSYSNGQYILRITGYHKTVIQKIILNK